MGVLQGNSETAIPVLVGTLFCSWGVNVDPEPVDPEHVIYAKIMLREEFGLGIAMQHAMQHPAYCTFAGLNHEVAVFVCHYNNFEYDIVRYGD
jgi:hypothetical protein